MGLGWIRERVTEEARGAISAGVLLGVAALAVACIALFVAIGGKHA